MRRWFELHPSVLRAPDEDRGGGGNGSDTSRVDPGAPHEVGVLEHEDEDPAERPARNRPAADDRTTQLEKDLTAERKARQESEQDAQYWAARARRIAADSDNQPAPRAAEPAPATRQEPAREMTPEELVDGLNKEGLGVLRKAGFISQAEIDDKLAALKTELTGTIRAERSDAEFGGRVAQEFPSIAQESLKLSRARAAGRDYMPTDPLFLRAGELYREAIADDPSLDGSQGIILATARMAQRELGLGDDGKPARRAAPAADRDRDGRFQPAPRVPETPARRRDRIERQRPDSGVGDEENPAGGEHFTEAQQTVMDKLGVKPEKFAAHRDAATRSQETRRNGRR